MTAQTFLWHDYETFGAVPRRDRPSQFAAIRTDAALNEIGEPLMIYCKPAPDYLPSPEATLITGITPQLCLERGLPEHEFAAQIERAFSQPGTIGVGYNTIRFDDEVTRFLFWRNLIDPYAREWQNECGRWDLLDVVRLTYALRPDGIQWPKKEDGSASFKLEDLAKANGLLHESAHDALSDVRATIALARLIRNAQPKLFDFAFALHRKDRVATELGLPAVRETAKPFLHVSGMFPAERGCLAVMWPLASHPTNKNELLAWDLAHDPSELRDLDADTVRLRMFTRAAELPEGVVRLPIKGVHLNKSPMVVGNLRTLAAPMAERWGIDLDTAMRHAAIARDLPDMSAIWARVYERPKEDAPDVDEDLYGGFVGNGDRRRLNQLRALSPAELARDRTGFDDGRLEEIVFRYRARNWPETLSEEEAQRWEEHRVAKLFDGEGGARTVEGLFAEIDALSETVDEQGEELLGALYDYADAIAPSR
ncbi:exonuclease I [Variovorax paradoxus]|jgi:exodeoxyribonuclease-1|uniref:exodeoxyribonuclease I n=1 Tax=Variovorax paradoxus TaxID=34073 RepID=UPI0006E6587C|nr:exonuclease I [Variovorax paradoxus]KPU99671.1 exonuclease I [Variovorax paradoxus]KPV05552.1 exonuclease I [Variovorax paradoxus]KPV15973.1 exonuclease I [Variovorax paradoxus]KPV26615.1 exonuclease I [Variovorax paradoxus]